MLYIAAVTEVLSNDRRLKCDDGFRLLLLAIVFSFHTSVRFDHYASLSSLSNIQTM